MQTGIGMNQDLQKKTNGTANQIDKASSQYETGKQMMQKS